MLLMQSENYTAASDDDESGNNQGSDMGSAEFDSEGESKNSSVATESIADEQTLYDQEPVGRAPGEVDLTGFNELCRKILAKKIPEGKKTGKKSKIYDVKQYNLCDVTMYDAHSHVFTFMLIYRYPIGILCRHKHSSAADRRALERERKKKVRAESKKKKNLENLSREKPQVKNSPFDKQLENIAKRFDGTLLSIQQSITLSIRGVVDFFNAIEKHQSELKRKLEEAGPTELRRSKVIKKTKERDVIDKIDDQQVKLLLIMAGIDRW